MVEEILGHLFTKGTITKEYPNEIAKQIASLPSNVTKVIHHICSGGGNCYAAYAGYHELMKIGKPIKSIIEGEAQSMATFLAIAPASEVEILEPSTFMIHEPFFPEGVAGTVDDLDSAKEELIQIRNSMAEAYAKKTGQPVEKMLAMMKKTTRLDARGAEREKFVDRRTEVPRIAALEYLQEEFQKLKEEAMSLFRKAAPVAEPKAIDLPLKSGGAIHIESENGDLVNKPVTIDGKPAEGAYELGDGRTLVCVGGVVTEVKEGAAAPQESAQQKLEKQLSDLTSQLNAMKAAEQAKINADAEKVKTEKMAAETKAAQEKAVEMETKLAAVTAELDKLKKGAAGNQDAPSPAMTYVKNPNGDRSPSALSLEQTKLFLYQNGFEYLTQRPNSPMYGYKPGPDMASVLETNFNYVWPGILTDEIFYKPQLTGFSLADFFIIDQGIKDRKQYNLIDRLDKILKPYGGCARVFTGNVDIMNTTVQTKEFQVGLEWCKDDFTNQLSGSYNILASEWLKTGNKSFDPTGTPIMQVIDKLASEALARDVFRRVFFAAGNSSDDDYNQIDGVWDRLIDSSGQSNYCVIDANGPVYGGTRMGLDALAANEAQTNLEAVYSRAPQILKNMSSKKFYVTRSVWENWFNTLTGVGAVTEQQYDNLVNGVTSLTYKGIPIVPVDLWDQFLTESDNPLFATTRHLILLTVKENHILGVENGADLNKLEGWYERKDRKFYIEGDMKFGYNYLHCDLSVLAR